MKTTIPASIKIFFHQLVDINPNLVRKVVGEELIQTERNKFSKKELEIIDSQDYHGVAKVLNQYALIFEVGDLIVVRLEDQRIFSVEYKLY